jgi:hypothetical protein
MRSGTSMNTTTPEQLAQIALTCRANAVLNPVCRTPMTMDDYLTSRMISTPCACSTATCTATGDGHRARAWMRRAMARIPIRLEAIGSGTSPGPDQVS